MKTKERKQNDLNALAEQLGNSKSAMIVSFSKLTVNKDQEFRNNLREAGAKYQVVKNTIARLAVQGTPYADAAEHFKGVTAIAWTDNDPVVLSKAISKFVKENAEFYTLKAGVVDGRVLNLKQVEAIASLPSKEELISKLLYVINAQAQRIVTVINAVPRDLAVVIKQIGEAKPAAPAAAKAEEPKAEAPVEAAPAAEEVTAEAAAPEATEETVEAAAPEATEETVEAAAPEATEETVEAAAPEATEEVVEAAAPEATEEAVEAAAPEATEETVEAAAPEATEEPVAEEAPAAEAEGEEKAE